MAKQNPKKIEEEVKNQDDQNYGEETVGGHQSGLETDDDSAKTLEKVIGNPPSEELNIAKEVDNDERDLATNEEEESEK